MEIADLRRDDFQSTVSRDLLGLCAGERLGNGMSRTVYAWAPDPKFVIKFETDAGRFQNVMEWEIWNRVAWVKGIGQWFAPCEKISACGTLLLMRRTDPIPKSKYPRKLPAFLTDLKPENFGVLNGKVVCHDYGYHKLIEVGMTSRMRAVDWS